MANKKISDGVGKKIVEALKKQSEIEINPKSTQDDELNLDELSQAFGSEEVQNENIFNEEPLNIHEEESFGLEDSDSAMNFGFDEAPIKQPTQQFVNYQQPSSPIQENFITELDSFEIPNNIAVLKKLISQLPSGVTRHTGAQIIKQTMEALGISMKSVLQEAQQVQEGLNTSAKECYSTVQEYKKQIMVLEKQAQNHQRQYAALNELISLFIQTGV